MKNQVTIATLSQEVTSESDAYLYFEDLRWNGRPVCAHCDSENVYFIEPTNGVSRKSSSGKMSERRVWRCRECKRQFSVITNTVMHGTKIALRIWVLVIFEMMASKNGVAAREIERKYGVTPCSAWFMLQRIRQAMGHRDGTLFSGDVTADECYIGGDPMNRHANERHGRTVGDHKSAGSSKTPVVSLIDADTGVARSTAVAWVDSWSIRQVITANVDMATTTLHTDSNRSYIPVARDLAGHYAVDHKNGIYATDKTNGTNAVEGFFSQLKRSIDGTHHHVSVEHLHRYLGEFDYRYSTRKMTDDERMAHFATKVAGRLTYKIVKTPAPL